MGRGLVITAITVAGAETSLSAALHQQAATQIESGAADAVCFTPEGGGRWVLAAPTDVLVVDEAALRWIDPDLISRIRGRLGPADPRSAMLDLQWRLNLNGHRVLALDGPITPRRQATIGDEQRRVSAVLTALTVLPGSALRGPLTSAAELYLVTGALAQASVDTSALDLQRSPGGDGVGTVSVPAWGVAASFGLDAALDGIGAAARTRASLQLGRRVPDRALTPLMETAVAHFVGAEDAAEQARLARLLDVCGIRPALAEPIHVLVVAPDTGPARERADRLAESLDAGVTLRLVRAGTHQITEAGMTLDFPLHEQPTWADVIVLIGATFDDLPGAGRVEAPLVIDLSTTDVIAWLLDGPPSGRRSNVLQAMVMRADLVLAADVRQRDLLLGALAGQLRVNAAVYDEDPSLTSLVRTDDDGRALADFCRRPVRAADSNLPPFVPPTKPGNMALAVKYLREGGPSVLAERIAGRIRRVSTRRALRKTR
jgi:hypothetical protein